MNPSIQGTQPLRRMSILQWAAKLSPIQIVQESKRGLKGVELGRIQQETSFTNEEWSRFLQLTTRTIQRYRREGTTIDSAVSERALIMAQIVAMGQTLFGSEQKFQQWLTNESSALGGTAPMVLLDTTTGMNLVRSELVRISYGVY